MEQTLRLDNENNHNHNNNNNNSSNNHVKSKYSQMQKMWHEWKRFFFYDVYAVTRERPESEKAFTKVLTLSKFSKYFKIRKSIVNSRHKLILGNLDSQFTDHAVMKLFMQSLALFSLARSLQLIIKGAMKRCSE